MTTTSIPLSGSGRDTSTTPEPSVQSGGIDARTLIGVAAIAGELGLVALVVRAFRLESPILFSLLLLSAAAFPIHALLPKPLRLRFFGLVSLVGLIMTLTLKAAAVVAGVGVLLVGVCHLPIRWAWRIALLGTAAIALGLVRTGVVSAPIPDLVWPVIGSIFMFRLALYVHALRHREVSGGFWPSLAYFTMMPNPAFPLFPVVDYKSFCRNHYDAPDMVIYQRGMRWIVRGVLHLMAYRLVYHHVTLDPLDVWSLGGLLRFTISTFLLYLRVSGQFHLIVGLLHLFGFRLPETHHLYYLAGSFTDLWRRINLYWTEFMMKLVYYPSFFRLRRLGQMRALLLSTALVFVVTWALHGWQSFWLLGTPHFTLPDGLFWGILAALVLVTTLREKRKPRRPTPKGWRAGRALAVTGTFLGMSLLWSLWSSESVRGWAGLFSVISVTTPEELLWIGVALIVALGITGFAWGVTPLGAGSTAPPTLGAHLRDGAGRAAVMAGALAFSIPAGRQLLPDAIREYAQSLGRDRLNGWDEGRLQQGYYEKLNAANRTGGQLWEALAQRPKDWSTDLLTSERVSPVEGVLLFSLKPDQSIVYRGQPFTTNHWGMRDRPYTRERTAGTFRIAILGSSTTMGYGVGDSEAYEAVLEEQLAGRKVEILNLAFEGHSMVQQLATYERQGRSFSPDLVLVTLTPSEHRLMATHLRRILEAGATIEYPFVAQVIDAAGLRRGQDNHTIIRRLRPHQSDLEATTLRTLKQRVEATGARLAVVVMRLPTQENGRVTALARRAADEGLPVLDLTEAYAGTDEDSLRLGDWDRHPNADGHRMLARDLGLALDRLRLLPLTSITASRGE